MDRNPVYRKIVRLELALILTASILFISLGCSDDTACPETADPPRITAHYPAVNDTLVPADTFLTVTFDMDMDPATVSAGSFTLEGPSGMVGASVSLDGATATLTPFEILAGHSRYTARVASGVSSTAGTSMGVDYAWSFTTDASPLLLYPEIEFTVRDSDGDSFADSIYVGGPPGRHLLVGELGESQDRAVMEFFLDGIVHEEVLQALIFITVYDVSVETVPVRMEAWGYSGNGTAEIADWGSGHLIVGYDFDEIISGTTYVFPMTDTVNGALAEGASYVGFRVVLTGGPHAQIYTTNAEENSRPKLILIQ
jgi:hypothetical protein